MNGPIWKVKRISSPPFGWRSQTACRMCNSLRPRKGRFLLYAEGKILSMLGGFRADPENCSHRSAPGALHRCSIPCNKVSPVGDGVLDVPCLHRAVREAGPYRANLRRARPLGAPHIGSAFFRRAGVVAPYGNGASSASPPEEKRIPSNFLLTFEGLSFRINASQLEAEKSLPKQDNLTAGAVMRRPRPYGQPGQMPHVPRNAVGNFCCLIDSS